MQNFIFNKGLFQNSKSQQRWRKTHKEKTNLYKETWEETTRVQGVDGENDGENKGEGLTKNENKPGD